MLGLQKHDLDFEIIESRNAKKIIFLDASDYFEQPESPLLQILLPGHRKYFLVNIEAGRINTFNSHTVGFTSILSLDDLVEFPDGVYEFTYKVCPYKTVNVTKYILRTTKFDETLSKVYSKIDCSDEKDCIKKELLDIHILIESAKANTYLGYVDKGGKDFSLAQQKVSKLLNKVLE